MKSLLVLVVGVLLFAAAPAGAAPFDGQTVTVRQPGGEPLALRVWGDEFWAVGETLDGYTVVRDPAAGAICYARLTPDGRALASTGVPAHEAAPAGLTPHLRLAPDAARDLSLASRAEFARRARAGAPALAPRDGRPTTGEVVGITLIIDFADDPGTILPGDVADYCNLPGYDGYDNHGSIYDYFHDVSGGLLAYTNHVPTQYYRASHTKAWYCDASQPYGQRASELIEEALAAMDAAGFDFSDYDADADGTIDALNCFYAGDIWNLWAEGLWPHAGWLFFFADGVWTERYQITAMEDALTIGTFCHENGHMLMGWPDLYDYGGESYGAGYYCLMAYGGHGGSGRNPIEPCAYMKQQAGWADVADLAQPQWGRELPAGDNFMYRYGRPGHANEYFLVENRLKVDRDASLPDEGLALWHIDTEGSNNDEQQTPWAHYLVTLVQADGRWDLEHGDNAGDGNDLFAAPTYMACTPTTIPDTGWWDDSDSGLSVTAIGAPRAVMTFAFNAWGNLQGPASVVAVAGAPSEPILGRAWLKGVTEAPGAAAGLVAQLGYGPDGSDPATWTWVDAAFAADQGGRDEFAGTLTIATPGHYDVAYRYAYQGGPWCYGDLDGSDNGYAPAQAGDLTVTGSVAAPEPLAAAWRLLPAEPNPFNPATTIRFDTAAAGPVTLAVYSAAGRLVATLCAEDLPAGRHARTWDGRDDQGRRVASGTFVCRLTAGGRVETRRLTLVK